ncbi:MAG TPA: tetratricopeptide repeat protein [Acidobacteriaceae bacterium]|nr:tetratricopeptide repeat protein [Acidobacteriaceae bacterium]
MADALSHFQDAVDSDPNYADAHSGLATALARQGRTAEAATEREKATALGKSAQ